MLKIRRSHDRLIFNMVILIPGETVFILIPGPDGLATQGTKASAAMVLKCLSRLAPEALTYRRSFHASI